MGDVPELSLPSDEGKGGGGEGEGQATSGSAESRLVARGLSSLLRASLLRYPMSAMQVSPLGRPTPGQLEQAAEVPHMLEALEVAGLLTVPQVRPVRGCFVCAGSGE